ncbi:MAG: LytR family transcriptional regulator, partial [Actinomycetota bacterium]|nr:LytR family transcriptional regulator [Actinomycetota bacterium]
DRERRQQAFIVSLATQLKQAGTLANPVKLGQIIDVTKQNTAIDSGLNLLEFASDAQQMAGGNVTFYTLPIASFGTDSSGEDINVVDLAQIHAVVAHLLGGPGSTSSATATASRPATTTHTPTSVPTVVPGTGAPAPTDLTAITGGGIPCVK